MYLDRPDCSSADRGGAVHLRPVHRVAKDRDNRDVERAEMMTTNNRCPTCDAERLAGSHGRVSEVPDPAASPEPGQSVC